MVRGFTLIEVLVVMTILGILATLGGVSFRSAQIRGQDAQRKANLSEIKKALEIFYNDYGIYPAASGGLIAGCPYNAATSTGTNCPWGTGDFTDSKGTTYMRTIPRDPVNQQNYYYRTLSNNKKFQLYARLGNSQDKDCLGGNCDNPTVPTGVNCGTGALCNFSITSSNTTPTE